MNKHERRAYDAGAQARELDVPLASNPFEESSNLGLWHAWGSGWNDADGEIAFAAPTDNDTGLVTYKDTLS